ncbi:Acyl-CoA reductase (LuxC) [Bacteroides faecichinchillae]|uniref:Acyl-CoA reductase (LuxC) n=1 Tax=Bacteroides faecichinchillae TaxID=871325 RepID=A0A1M5DRT4_9BACE|nr:acyl-CoA reductase [Bacteroides faecichinchillae]SHF69660.1 Acyl-CoA reductase (LuxC) [Bacteroides faecichinchillae]
MRKSADVVILMQPSSNYTLLFPKEINWEEFTAYRPDVPFSDEVVEFLNALSGAIMKDRLSRLYPDAITFAYFCRKANLLKLKVQYVHVDELRLGRGVLFHIAPSNVPINFGYSLVAGLLAGNANIVRVSSKQFAQVDLIIKHMHELLESGQYNEVANRIALVRYDRSSDASAYFSSIANVRVIWGGDATIQTIRQNSIPVRSFDVCFADRYSIAVIRPSAIMAASNTEMKKLAEAFYNDTYLFDQNACSAPHTIFWLNDPSLTEAKERFWSAVHDHVATKYQLQAVMAVDKLTALYRQAVCMNIMAEPMPDNIVVRVDLNEVPINIDDFRCSCGYFSEKTIESLDEISPIVSSKYQTLGYFGFEKEEFTEFVCKKRFQGLDRIVPIGETTTFSLTWDGFNLIEMFTRIPSIL